MSIHELELAAYPEFEEEWEEEYEGEWEQEAAGTHEFEEEWEGEFEGEWENEDELELEAEWEAEYEANPLLRVYPDALMEMEHLGHAASEAESEAEAEAFIGALVPLAARLVPKVAPALMKAAPRLIKQASNVTKTLRRDPSTRQLVRAVPQILQRTAQSLASQAAHGRSVTPMSALRTLNRMTTRVLRSPKMSRYAIRRSHALDRRFHRRPPGPGYPVRRRGPHHAYGRRPYRARHGQRRPHRGWYRPAGYQGAPGWAPGGGGAVAAGTPVGPAGPAAIGPYAGPAGGGGAPQGRLVYCPCCGRPLGG